MFSTRDAAADHPDIEKEIGRNPSKREARAVISKCKTADDEKSRWLALRSISPSIVGV